MGSTRVERFRPVREGREVDRLDVKEERCDAARRLWGPPDSTLGHPADIGLCNQVQAVNEGLAIIYAELADDDFTGIGISFGGPGPTKAVIIGSGRKTRVLTVGCGVSLIEWTTNAPGRSDQGPIRNASVRLAQQQAG